MNRAGRIPTPSMYMMTAGHGPALAGRNTDVGQTPSRVWMLCWLLAIAPPGVCWPLFADVDGHIGRKAGAQHRRVAGAGRPGDAHGDTLHDLDEAAGGVVGGQQREAGAGSARDALHPAGEL